MHDQHSRQALMDALKQRVKKAASTVSTKVEAEQGNFKVVISENNIDQFYENQHVGRIKVSNLDDETIEMINDNPNDAAKELLDGFTSSFNIEAHASKITKEAAHRTQDEKTHQMITQKQFDEQKPNLHPRTDEFPKEITQKQLVEDGQRPGTYDIITEGQMRDETSTFYNDPLIAGKRQLEDRSIVTEGQLNEGAKTYSELGQSDREQTGSKYDGDYASQKKVINEKQLLELLKHHEWTEPLTITEGKEQLGGQDGEIGRLTAEVGNKIIKEALESLAKTVLAAGVTPARLVSIVSKLVSHPSKYPVLANSITNYKDKNTQAIESRVVKAQYFGKVANTKEKEWSDGLIADILVRQLAKIAHNPNWIVKSLVAMSNAEKFAHRINEAADFILNNKEQKLAEDNEIDLFKTVLSGNSADNPTIEGSADDDGLYEYNGVIEEIKASVDDKDAFMKEAAEVGEKNVKEIAKKNFNKDVDVIPDKINVDKEAGIFRIIFKDASFKLSEKELNARAEKRRELAKTASKKEAQVGGGGGMPPAAGPEMGNPAPPAGGADAGAPPPGEALQTPPPPEEEGLEEPGAGTGEPQPPGSICPVCGTNDVDVDNGEFRCNSCGAEGQIHVNLEVSKWPETITETEAETEEGFGLGAEEAGLGEEGDLVGEGAGTTLPNVPIAASVRITPYMLEKIAKQNITIGSVCPNCGSNNTDIAKSASAKGQHGICWNCMQEYNFQIKAAKNKKHKVFAQYTWKPNRDATCSNCTRLKTAFMKSLKNYGMKWAQFSAMNMKEQGELIVKMAKSNALDIHKAMNTSLIKSAASPRWRGYGQFDKFPSASCMERIARRFGENATAMSGPCQGKSLAKCVCSQLENMGIYTDGLAAKVASALGSKDPMEHSPTETCVQMFVKSGYPVKDACTACDGLRAAYATTEDLMIEAVAQFNPQLVRKPKPMPTPGSKPGMNTPGMPPKPMPAPAKPMPGGPTGSMGGDSISGGGLPSAPSMPKPMSGPSPMPSNMPSAMPSPMEGDMGDDMGDDMGGMDMGNDIGMGGDIGDMGDDMMGDMIGDNDIGANLDLGEDMVTIQVPAEAADIIETLIQALSGDISDDMIDNTDEFNGDITDDIHGDMNDEMGSDNDIDILEDSESDSNFGRENENHDGDSTEKHNDGNNSDDDEDWDTDEDNGIPGLSEDSDEDDGLIKETNEPHDTQKKDMKKPMPHNNRHEQHEQHEQHERNEHNECKPCHASTDENSMLVKEASAKDLDQMLYRMKQGSISRQSDAIDSLIDGIMAQSMKKEALKTNSDIKKVERTSVKETKVKETPAQETPEIGKIKDNGKIGHESAFTDGVSKKPDIPRSAATIGGEGKENTLDDSDRPTVPHGSSAMAGEKNYTSEKGNQVDGNQGGKHSAATKEKVVKTAQNKKTAACECGSDKNCDCGSGKCTKCCPCQKGKKAEVKYTIKPGHKIYNKLTERIAKGQVTVKLADNHTYQIISYSNDFLLIPSQIIKESQTVSPKSVKKLEDDPDLNPGSGPGKGKTHADEKHSLGVDEKKPSEGMSEPSVPKAPNKGQLANEHTVTNELDGPSIPAGGGMNPEYDQNEKNEPEKQDQTLGKHNDIAALAETRNRATKIAGQLLKTNQISIDELSDKIAELVNATPRILDDYEKMLNTKEASVTKGLQKEASGIESPIVSTPNVNTDTKSDLKTDIQGLFRLDQRNKDFEKYAGKDRLFR